MANEFWLNEKQWAVIEPLIPMDRRGVKPGRNREVISGILHVLKYGCRWRDCPEVCGPHTAFITADAANLQCIDCTSSKAHRCSAGGKGGPIRRLSAAAVSDARPNSMPSLTAWGA
jgi:transposase